MEKLNYFNLQCHMILKKSFFYSDLLLKKHSLLSMLKTVNIFVETMMHDPLNVLDTLYLKK